MIMKIIKVPFSNMGKGKGSEEGPDKIIEQMNDLYCNEFGKEGMFEIIEVNLNPNNAEETNEKIIGMSLIKHP